jgi:hypothetical protein
MTRPHASCRIAQESLARRVTVQSGCEQKRAKAFIKPKHVLSSSQSPNRARAAGGFGEEKLSGGMRVRGGGHNLKAQAGRERKILIWFRHNPLKSPESDE